MIIIAKVKLDTNTIKKINNFVEKSFSTNTSHYRKRNQSDVGKIKQDIYNGKLAEFAVYYYLKPSYEINEPDVEVYTANQKSFDADLTMVNNNNNNNKKKKKKGKLVDIHVKSQHVSSADRFGESWSFQVQDSLVSNPKQEDFICLCIVLDEKQVEIVKMLKAVDIIDKYSDPKLNKLKGIKKVLYYEDIK